MCTIDIHKQYSNTFHKDQLRCDAISSRSLSPSDKLSSLNIRKRKRNEDTLKILSNDSFLLKPYPANVSVRSRTLQPLVVLPRSCLPLSFLDFSSSADSLGSTRLFKTHVKALDLEGNQPMVLVARDKESRSLFVLEKEGRGLYAVCQVGSWVSLQTLYDAAGTPKQSTLKAFTRAEPLPSVISPSKLVANSPRPEAKDSSEKKRRLVIEAIQSMVKKSSTLPQTEPYKQLEDAKMSPIENEPTLDLNPVNSAPSGISSSQSSTEIFENIRTHYFETLYLSRISLAYFVKGPLSRARAAFHPETTYNIGLNDYCAFLYTLIVPISLLNKKYKDGISNCILKFDTVDYSDNMDDTKIKTKKKNKTKISKLRKNGLYSNEDILIQKWWVAHEDEKDDLNLGAPESTKDELMKSRISELRIRETQLQIILILEALTFQGSSPCINETDKKQSELCLKKVKSKKKPHTPSDLHILIDIYVDRLCIWQSIAMEYLKDSRNLVEIRHGQTSYAKLTESLLRDFCVEVIIPFFSSRLPDKCALISEKLGVPVIAPQNTKISQSSSTSHALSRPGAATKRSLPLKPNPSLKQVLNRDRKRRCVSQGHGKAIALMRSATMPIIPSLKKDNSEALSCSVTINKDSSDANMFQTQRLRLSSQRDAGFAQSEIGNNPKGANKVNIDLELKNAISILRKPSRQLASKDTADLAIQRAVSLSHPKTSKKTSRKHITKEGVEIFATPKTSRNKHIFEKIQNSNPPPENNCPASSQKLLTISKATPQKRDDFITDNSPFCLIQATPSRAPGSNVQKETSSKQNLVENKYLCQSPLNVRRSSAQLFGSMSESSNRKLDKCWGNLDTPVKRRGEASQISNFLGPETVKENQPDSKTKVVDKSIYQVLGWDEDFG
ncbi:putative protein kinase-like [Erysiphe neolycopersici]|uniref:DNA replication regulator Sld3 C-terminal domain-containing protein n=1 Tax=Erysiphe neolycopersici TaxID=212602 RepID=A0A420HCB1_9PEZI|nr:putative protein kinase-like [Erysiphe neolycopersici]